jgi:hypothetical protein
LEARQEGLSILQNLFKLKLIEIFHWGKHHEIIKQLDLNTKQTIKFIDVTWFEGADFEDFVDMPMFKYKDWYLNALKNEGLTHTTNWKSFVEEKIGNLEKWIEENKPK